METFYRTSRLTGKRYDAFDSVNLLNLKQVTAYIKNGVLPLDIYASKDRETGQSCLVYVFSRSKTKDVYDLWCKHMLT